MRGNSRKLGENELNEKIMIQWLFDSVTSEKLNTNMISSLRNATLFKKKIKKVRSQMMCHHPMRSIILKKVLPSHGMMTHQSLKNPLLKKNLGSKCGISLFQMKHIYIYIYINSEFQLARIWRGGGPPARRWDWKSFNPSNLAFILSNQISHPMYIP
jgi:hypothetical protein